MSGYCSKCGKKKINPPRKRMEFKKKLAAISVAVIVVSIAIPTWLSMMDKNPLETLFISTSGAAFAYLVTYATTSYLEKNSRNKHGLDEDGRPFDMDPGTCGPEAESTPRRRRTKKPVDGQIGMEEQV